MTTAIESSFRAQFGEDRVLWRIFRERPRGYFIEVGAYDGVTLSNTYFLEQMGWHGILIEPILELCRKAAVARTRSRIIHAAVSRPDARGTADFTIAQNVPVLSFLNSDQAHVDRCLAEGATLVTVPVPVVTLDDVIRYERNHAPQDRNPWIPRRGWSIDLVSIDVEGGELEVLEGLSLERFKPRILLLENDRPAGVGIEPYLASRGYRKFHRQKINDFYLRNDDAADDLTLSGLDAVTETP